MNSPNATEPVTDPFESGVFRAHLARKNNLNDLKATYASGTPPELEDMSSAQLWDELALCSDAPAFRTRRPLAVADELKEGAKILNIGIG